MKSIKFQMLQREWPVPDNYFYIDLGFTKSLLDSLKKVMHNAGQTSDDEHLMSIGADISSLQHKKGGYHVGIIDYPFAGARTSYIFYTKSKDIPTTLTVQCHEEAHSAIFLGLRSELENIVLPDYPAPGNLTKEELCDWAACAACREWGVEPPKEFLLQYNESTERNIYSVRELLLTDILRLQK